MKTTNMVVFCLVLLTLLKFESLCIHLPNKNTFEDNNWNVNNNSNPSPNIWAVLVAGTLGWFNYRFQADVYHAYQILRENGIPKENIITMAVDDIANHFENPKKGKVFNSDNGKDVYDGVIIDYKGHDVNSDNFLNVIKGNKKAMQSIGSGKVIKAKKSDTIFILLNGHGEKGLFRFPYNNILYADQLNHALNVMHSKKSYGKILLFIDSCHSGSMFNGILRDDINVLAVTSAGPNDLSWAAESYDLNIDTELGNQFYTVWMELVSELVSEEEENNRTVFYYFNRLRTYVNNSNVLMYGDFTIGHENFCNFIGKRPRGKTLSTESLLPSNNNQETVSGGVTKLKHLKMESDLRPHFEKKIKKATENDEMRSIIEPVFQNIYLKLEKLIPDVINYIGTFDESIYSFLSLNMYPCYRNIVTKINENCFSVPNNIYILHRLNYIANLCAVGQNLEEMVKKIIVETCSTISNDVKNANENQ